MENKEILAELEGTMEEGKLYSPVGYIYLEHFSEMYACPEKG